MEVAYSVVLCGEFVHANGKSGDKQNAFRDFYFKVLPKGRADVPGVLLGFPALDAPPFGTGWQTTSTSHCFSALSLHMPHAELKARTHHIEALQRWQKDDPPRDTCGNVEHCRFLSGMPMTDGQCQLLARVARSASEEVCTLFNGEPFSLEPKEQDIVAAS